MSESSLTLAAASTAVNYVLPSRSHTYNPAKNADTEAVVVIARTTQDAIVVNLDALDWSEVTLP